MKLIETPLSSLFPPRSEIQGQTQFKLPPVHLVQVSVRKRNGKVNYYRLYRQPQKKWWAVHSRNNDGDWGHPMRGNPIRGILQSLQKLKPITHSSLSPKQAQIQIAFFTQGEQFLLRILQAPDEQVGDGTRRGEWLLYYHGELYQQNANGPLSRAIPRLKRALRRLRRRRGWLRMPLNSNNFTIPVARRIAQQFHEKRKSLKRCFKKRRFPYRLGPLKFFLAYSGQGKMIKRKILTRAHAKHKLIWCVWWRVKQWKFKPPPGKPIQFQLVVPPQGP